MINFREDFKEFEESIIILEKSEGYRDYNNGGIWIEGEPIEVEDMAIVSQLSVRDLNSRIKHDEGGYYTLSDIKIIIYRPLNEGQKIKWKDKEYTIADEVDYSNHVEDLRMYLAKKSSIDASKEGA